MTPEELQATKQHTIALNRMSAALETFLPQLKKSEALERERQKDAELLASFIKTGERLEQKKKNAAHG